MGSITVKEAKIYNGVPWYDQSNHPVNAHGGCLVKKEGKYYFFGEYKTNKENKFNGFSCYSSVDLSTWFFEGISLDVQKEGLLGPHRVGERPKVLPCRKTGKYIMLMHTDSWQYDNPVIGIAVSDQIDGQFKFLGALRYEGEPVRRWDMGTFIDEDERGYLLLHEGGIYRLSEDYLSVEARIVDHLTPGGESPTMFKQNGFYYFLFSNKTSWERNDNYYLSATQISGPWKHQGLFCPEGSLTFNSQCTFVFPYTGEENFMYMGDRWSFPRQASSATYVWLPIKAEEGSFSISEYWETWEYENFEATTRNDNFLNQPFKSNVKDTQFSLWFEGRQIELLGESNPDGGYAEIIIYDKKSEIVQTSIIDFYSLVSHQGIRFVSLKLPYDTYQLKVRVLGETGEWFKKDGTRFGGKDCLISISGVRVLDSLA